MADLVSFGRSNLRILVVGAGGFIGSHIVELLLERGHQVTALCKYNSNGTFGWLNSSMSRDNKNLDLLLGDITDTEQIERIVDGHTILINASALIGIPYSYVAPRSYMNVNSLGVLNLLEASRKFKTRLLQMSTSEIYGTPKSVPITLDHAPNPQSPYAASKLSADLLCRSYSYSFEVETLIIRPFNTYGPRQSLRAVIPTILSQLVHSEGKIRLGSTNVRRDFTYVSDTAKGIVDAAESQLFDGRTIQLGTGISFSIEEIIQICKEEFGMSIQVIREEARIRPKGSEIPILESDPSSALQFLNWEPEVQFRDGLRRTFEWIKSQNNSRLKTSVYRV